jgi:hypothetical protein
MNGTVAVGASRRYARADHVHASDTSKVSYTGATAALDLGSYALSAAGVNASYLAATDSLELRTASTARLAIDSSGNVEIGTSPTTNRQKLYVGGSIELLAGGAIKSRPVGTSSPRTMLYGDASGGSTYLKATDNYAYNGCGMYNFSGTLLLFARHDGSVIVGPQSVVDTTATAGFVHLPSCAGTPTGTPTTFTGKTPMVVDTTNGRLYFYYGSAWHYASLT